MQIMFFNPGISPGLQNHLAAREQTGQGMLTKQLLRIMKLTALILFTACMQVCATGYSQRVSLSEKNAPPGKIFHAIEKQTGYVFFYPYSILKELKPVTVDVKNAPLDQVLAVCFKGQPVNYSIENKTIILTHKPVSPPPVIDVRGKVVNEQGKPVLTSIAVKGTQQGANTNERGEFVLTGIDENAVLIISGIGIETIEVKLNGRTEITINTTTAVSALDEMVIKGYYTTSKRLNTGNVSKVSREEINRQPVNNPLLALQGRVPGMYITQTTGLPGSAVNILIRGKGSLNASTTPLFVIDGVPYDPNPNSQAVLSNAAGNSESAFISINPADIESIEVLKDADATAIYGSRGANGVILITTRKARAGKTALDVNVQHGISEVAQRAALMNAEEYVQMRKDAFANDGVTPTAANAPDLLTWDAGKTTDWQNLLFGRTAKFTDAQVSLSGGSELARVLFNSGYHHENTIYAPDNMGDKRFSTRLNADLNSRDTRLNMNTTVSYSVNVNNLPISNGAQEAFRLPPHLPLYNADGSPNWSSGFNFPLAFLSGAYESKSHTLIANSLIRYRILPGLDLRTSVGYTRRTSDQQALTPLATQNPVNATSSSRFSNSSIETYIIEPQLDYKLNIGAGQLAALLGGTLQQMRTEREAINASGFNSDASLGNLAAAGSITVSNGSAHYRYNSVFARLGYNWNKKYVANITFRRDGSSRFGPGRQFGNFGAIGAAWIFSEEPWIKNSLSFLSFGKLRGSYGITGNDQIGDYQYLATYGAGTAYQGLGSFWPQRVVNDDFGWEENHKIELAAELGFLRDRISVTASYYRNRSSNSLINYPVPQITGFGSYQANFPALVQNTGWEFSLNSVNISQTNFKWETSFNLSLNRNKLVSFPNIEKTSYATLYTPGASLYRARALHFTGVDPQTGLAQFEDLNGDGVISYIGTSSDMTFYDNDLNDFYGGIGNTLTWKNIRLDFLFQFEKRIGNTAVNNSPLGTLANQYALLLDYWKKPGDLTATPKPSATAGTTAYNSSSNWLLSDALFGDASYMKLKNVSLTYTLPQVWLKRINVAGCEVFARAQNLFSITAYEVLDPETGSLVIPPARVITAGIHCTF